MLSVICVVYMHGLQGVTLIKVPVLNIRLSAICYVLLLK